MGLGKNCRGGGGLVQRGLNLFQLKLSWRDSFEILQKNIIFDLNDAFSRSRDLPRPFLLYILMQIYTRYNLIKYSSFYDCKYKVYGTGLGFWKLFSAV